MDHVINPAKQFHVPNLLNLNIHWFMEFIPRTWTQSVSATHVSHCTHGTAVHTQHTHTHTHARTHARKHTHTHRTYGEFVGNFRILICFIIYRVTGKWVPLTKGNKYTTFIQRRYYSWRSYIYEWSENNTNYSCYTRSYTREAPNKIGTSTNRHTTAERLKKCHKIWYRAVLYKNQLRRFWVESANKNGHFTVAALCNIFN
jgi:hypothetical protein